MSSETELRRKLQGPMRHAGSDLKGTGHGRPATTPECGGLRRRNCGCRTGGEGEEAIQLLPLLGIKGDPSLARDNLSQQFRPCLQSAALLRQIFIAVVYAGSSGCAARVT